MKKYIQEICLEQSKKSVEVFDRLDTIANLVLSSVNTVAGKAISDVHERLKVSKYYRMEVKKFAKEAQDAYYEYEKSHRKNFEGRDGLFLDFLDRVEDNIKQEYNATMLSIWTYFILSKEPEPELRAKIEFAHNLTALCTRLYDLEMDIAKRETGYTFDFDKIMKTARLTKPLHFIRRLNDEFIKVTHGHLLDLNEQRSIVENFKNLENKLIDNEFIEKAGYEALELNPDYKAEVTQEDWEELENKYKEK